jgi:Regulator of ribonuclease activity B
VTLRAAILCIGLLSASCSAGETPEEPYTMVNDPSQQSELAIETLQLFVQDGEDLSDVRHTVHYFYGGNHVALGEALQALGYSVRPTASQDGVIAERMAVTDEQWRTETLRALSELANEYGSEYDGWEASMTRQGKN